MRSRRSVDELIGLCRGILADGVLVQEEAEFLLRWLQQHREVANAWPARALYDRVARALADGTMDSNEEHDLIVLLLRMEDESAGTDDADLSQCDSPIDCPQPTVIFPGRHFCFTGQLVCGPRSYGEGQVVSRGGRVSPHIGMKTDYLVIGRAGSTNWSHRSFGNKIQRAVELRSQGHPIAILSEDHWYSALGASAP